MAEEQLSAIDQAILSRFHRDSLCGKCGGPIEIDRLTTCWKCDLLPHIRSQLDWIDMASMNMAIQLKIRRPMKPVRELPPEPKPEKPAAKPKTKPKKPAAKPKRK